MMSVAFFLVSSIFFQAYYAKTITDKTVTYLLLLLFKQSDSISEKFHVFLSPFARDSLVSERPANSFILLLVLLIAVVLFFLLRRATILVFILLSALK